MAQENKMFPIQSQRGAAPHPTRIPWSVADLAYSVYSGLYGRSQSLERLAERGGFGPGEMDDFLPGWRDRCDRIAELETENARLKTCLADADSFMLGGDLKMWDDFKNECGITHADSMPLAEPIKPEPDDLRGPG